MKLGLVQWGPLASQRFWREKEENHGGAYKFEDYGYTPTSSNSQIDVFRWQERPWVPLNPTGPALTALFFFSLSLVTMTII